jgi:hypothetical protein
MSSEHPDDAVVVATFPNEYEADLAVSWLEAEGVASVVIADDAGGAYPMLQMERGVKVLVTPENADRAREILAGAADRADDRSDDPAGGASGGSGV